MPSVASSFEKFVGSLFGIFSSIVGSILAFFQSLLALGEGAIKTSWALITNTLSFVFSKFSTLYSIYKMLTKLDNAFVIVVVAGAFLAFGAYQKRVQEGKPGIPTASEVQARANDLKQKAAQ